MKIRIAISLSLMLLSTAFTVHAQQKELTRVDDAVRVLREFGTMKEDIPQELLNISEGIIIVPKMINAGFVIAGKRGRGIALIKDEEGNWSDPVFITITGGSVGFQAGVQSVDLVLIFKNSETLEEIGNGTFTLGGDVSATAGPVGRSGTATTDYKMEAEVYSYSKSKGLFAGISLSGAAISVDRNANNLFYGEELSAADIFSQEGMENASVALLKRELQVLYNGEVE
ncbi:MAG: lipid-binding SYLF domain-containing protein [Chitinophagaceae bacterium]|nr:lipid-binding SYLF domain-containing protein [Chitinophagaceae bacterium]MCZ2396383.1 lipid-binding SYLF domain-containing protein [Chitinophagales bacterium]